jgi:hypothetical protein
MKNRYRIELYDEDKNNDLTLFSDTKIDKEQLTEIAFSNLTHFFGNLRAYVYDNLKKKKTTALFLPEQIVNKDRPRTLTKIEIGWPT